MPEIKLHLRNRTKAELRFTVGDATITLPPHGSRSVSAESGVRPFVSAEGLEGDMWIYDITEDTSLDCSLVGKELKLRAGGRFV
jgi:hypothetical protein